MRRRSGRCVSLPWVRVPVRAPSVLTAVLCAQPAASSSSGGSEQSSDDQPQHQHFCINCTSYGTTSPCESCGHSAHLDAELLSQHSHFEDEALSSRPAGHQVCWQGRSCWVQ